MKTILILFLGFCLAASTQAQAPAAPATAPLLTPDQLDQLLGPIALYPDSLIALILPASTLPSDIVLAGRYQSGNGDPAQIPNQSWDDSVKALTRFPDILQWLNQNLDWTTQLGDAFLSQPADVMDAIQQLRAQAKAAGHLANTTQQQVVVDNGDIFIEPTDPNAIYAPQYDPETIYDEGGYADTDPYMTFGPAYPVGAWLDYGMDWQHHGVYVGDWRAGSDYRGRNGSVGGNANITNTRPWRPNAHSVQRQVRISNQGSRSVASPKPLPGVKIPQGTHAAGNAPAGAATPSRHQGNLSTATRPDFTGRVESRPSVTPGQGQRVAPAVVSPAPAPQGSILNDYHRGSAAVAASARGQASRQLPTAATAAAPQRVAPPQRAAPPARSAAPQRVEAPQRVAPPQRAAPPARAAAPQRAAAPASAFHVGAAPAAHAASAKGAQSRAKR